MKTSRHAAFTLVEIMIVVVIIGLLAALAIPAFKKVRNNSIEKSLVNDARQISSASQQYYAENGDGQVATGQVAKFLNGNKLSSGVKFGTNNTCSAGNNLQNGTDLIDISGYFYLGHDQYDYTMTSNGKIMASGTSAAGTLNTVLRFNSVDGVPN